MTTKELLLNAAGEPMSTEEAAEFIKQKLEGNPSIIGHFRNFVSQMLADLQQKNRSAWFVGLRIVRVIDMELLDGDKCNAYQLNFHTIPPVTDDGMLTEEQVNYVMEYMTLYQCALRYDEEERVVNFIETVKKSEFDRSVNLARELIDQFRKGHTGG